MSKIFKGPFRNNLTANLFPDSLYTFVSVCLLLTRPVSLVGHVQGSFLVQIVQVTPSIHIDHTSLFPPLILFTFNPQLSQRSCVTQSGTFSNIGDRNLLLTFGNLPKFAFLLYLYESIGRVIVRATTQFLSILPKSPRSLIKSSDNVIRSSTESDPTIVTLPSLIT